jgi:hypothetical protein
MKFLRDCAGVNTDRLSVVVTKVGMGHDDGPEEWLAMALGRVALAVTRSANS